MNEEFKLYLKKETDLIFENYDSFTDSFIKGNIIDMYEIRFGASEVSFVYISECGSHYIGHITFDDYDKWKEKIKG